ncbi:hypothetical protein TNCV_709461 [Trichonephila clavipes]|nr:hypothetical protein TNCV_709461 [Trichonephila clavipes]
MHVTMGSLFIVWPRKQVDPLTGSHNGQWSAHRVTRDEACLANASDALEIYERIDLRNKGYNGQVCPDVGRESWLFQIPDGPGVYLCIPREKGLMRLGPWKNHRGFAGGMEVCGMQKIFLRSEQKHGFKYQRYIGDGDSKTFLSIAEKEPYGDSVPIVKIECGGHV